jgi:DHA1 family quinolone resistance protein-like MFS transporter
MEMNKTLMLLLASDVFLLTGFGLMSPIFAIFIKDDLTGGTLVGAGIATAIFLIVKACVQIPFSRYIDNHDGRKKWLLIGTSILVLVPLIYIFAKDIKMIYLAQIIYGIGAGMAAASWLTIWSRHLDKNHEGFEWSVYSAAIGIGTGVTAMIGAIIAQLLGFRYTFGLVALLSLVGAIILLRLETKDELEQKELHMHYHSKRKLVNHH